MKLYRAESLNDSPLFVQAVAELARASRLSRDCSVSLRAKCRACEAREDLANSQIASA